MNKNIGLVWLKEDFRLKRNNALAKDATKNHDNVVVFYLYKSNKFKFKEAQKWWISKSLEEFKKKLNNFNINLEIIQTENYKPFLKNFSLEKFLNLLE